VGQNPGLPVDQQPRGATRLCRPVAIPVTIFIELNIAMLVKPSNAKPPHSTRENAMTRAQVLGAAALALSTGAASAQGVYPSYGYGPAPLHDYAAPAPLYDYAGPGLPAPVHAAPHGYRPLIYAPQLYALTPAFPAPPAEPGYYTAQSVVVSQPLYDYAPGYWGR
jgi:hypothetical protein